MQDPFSRLDPHVLPPPLSTSLEALFVERDRGRRATAAADTAAAIEAWFSIVGALLLAEYMDAGAVDDNVNRRIFQALEQKRAPSLGRLLGVARACQQSLRDRSVHHPPIWPSLDRIDCSDADDSTHPAVRLLAFRNSFSHGSFTRADADTREHALLLARQLRLVIDDLADRPLRYKLPTGETCVLQGPGGTVTSTRPSSTAPEHLAPFVPFVTVSEGSTRVVGPILQVVRRGDGWRLELGRLGSPASVEWRKLGDALDRYRREKSGYVQFGDLVPRRPDSNPHGVPGFEGALARNAIVLIAYRPGTGQANLAARLLTFMHTMSSPARIWRVVPDHPGSSGVAFGRFLLRLAEEARAGKPVVEDLAGRGLIDAVLAADASLTKAGKSVGVIVMDAGLAGSPSTEEPRLTDIFERLSRGSGGYRLALLAEPTDEARIPRAGAALDAALPEPGMLDGVELAAAVRAWRTRQGAIADAVLGCVLDGAAATPVSVVAFAELVEARCGRPVFPPAVEHALWTAAPLLERHRDPTDERLSAWIPAGGVQGHYAAALCQMLRPCGVRG